MRGDLGARGRRPAAASRWVVALALAVLAVSGRWATAAFGAGAPGVGHSSVVVQRVHSRPDVRAFWTLQRMRAAKPFSVLSVSKDGIVAQAGDGGSPAAADPSANGTDTGDPTVYPNSANGVAFFQYGTGLYRCSGSVVDSNTGNLVLTAGHCVIAPGSGTRATNIIFVPGYRDGAHTFGDWAATRFTTTAEWENTTHTGNSDDADEAGDMAILNLANRPSDAATVQSVVGAVGIAFNQSRFQTYMEYGYPVAFPYDGTRLYKLTAPWAVDDPSFSPQPIGISSDFTGGSSGGPWLVGNPPVAMSVTDYRHTSGPLVGYMFGPYFGDIAQQLYATAKAQATSGASVPLPPAAPPANGFGIELLGRNRHRGVVVLGAKVPAAGDVELRGNGLRPLSKTASGRQTVVLRVRAKGSALVGLRDTGRLRVHAEISYQPTGGSSNSKGRDLVLVMH